MMRWIILALSLGASLTSLVHGVFVLFGFLVAGGGSSPWVSGGLPILSAFLALIGGIVAFNCSKVGIAFLGLAALLCLFAPVDVWIYGSVYLIAAMLSFFLPRRSDLLDYEDYDYDDQDCADDDEELPIDFPPKRHERAARISLSHQEREKRIPLSTSPEEPPKVRRRTSKTCPTCGASVAIDHRFCPTCGSSLHIPTVPEPEEALKTEVPVQPDASERGAEAESAPWSPNAAFVSPAGESSPSSPDLGEDDDSEPEQVGQEGPFQEEEMEIPLPHKVFVKPLREETLIPTRPLSIDPDTSYQEFSRYTRRRKRRTRPLGRRILGLLLLFAVVGGGTWFLLGLRKLPEDKLPVLPPVSQVEVPPTPRSIDVVAQPLTKNGTSDVSGELPSLPSLGELPDRGIVTGSNVNLREEHSTASKSLTRLGLNAQAELLESWTGVSGTLSGVWYRVRSGGKEGWIYGQYFLPLGKNLPKGYTDALLHSFGGSRNEAAAKLGRPAQNKAASLEWQGLTLSLKDDAVSRLQVSSARYPLRNGVTVGMTQDVLFKTMGYPSALASGQLRYLEEPKRGVAVRIGKDGKITAITVGSL